MNARIWKWLVLTAGGTIVIVLLAIVTVIVADQIAYEKANVTDALLRDGRYVQPRTSSSIEPAPFLPKPGWIFRCTRTNTATLI